MAEGEVRYCTTEDGIRIAYRVEGDGPPLLVCHESVESFSLDHMMPNAVDFFRELGRGRRVIRFDPRGVGLSQRDISDFSLQGATRDIHAVIKATRLRRVSILAWCVSGPRAIAFVAEHPRLVERLILYATTARPRNVFSKESTLAIAALWRTNPTVASQAFSDLTDRERYPEFGFQAAAAIRQSINGADASRWFEQGAEEDIDVTPLLSRIRARTLVLQRRGDGIYPVSEAQTLAAGIPNTRLMLFEGNAHYFALEDPGAIIEAVNTFLGNAPAETPRREKAMSRPAAADVHTILFTDLASSTAITQRLGDAKAQELVRAHNTIVREALASHGGTEIKHTGDGIMASFGSASAGLDCAVLIQRGVADHDADALAVKIGLNAGEPVAEEAPDGRDDLFGTAVQLARRVCDEADGGEILVSDVVRQLAAGKDFLFSDRGVAALKGFDEPVRVWEVRWRE